LCFADKNFKQPNCFWLSMHAYRILLPSETDDLADLGATSIFMLPCITSNRRYHQYPPNLVPRLFPFVWGKTPFSYPEPFLRVVNGARRGALAKSISNWHLIGYNEGYCSNTGYILLPCFHGIRLWIWPEPLVAPRVRRALGTRMVNSIKSRTITQGFFWSQRWRKLKPALPYAQTRKFTASFNVEIT
jgi:hypothetical protein